MPNLEESNPLKASASADSGAGTSSMDKEKSAADNSVADVNLYEEKIAANREKFCAWLMSQYLYRKKKNLRGVNTLLFGALIIRGVSYRNYFEQVKDNGEGFLAAGNFLREIETAKCAWYALDDIFDEQDKLKAIRACAAYSRKYLAHEIPENDGELVYFFGKEYVERYAAHFQGNLDFKGEGVQYNSLPENEVVQVADSEKSINKDFIKGTESEFINKLKTELINFEISRNFKKVDGRVTTRYEYFNGEFQSEQEIFAQYAHRKTGFKSLDEKQIFAPGLYVLGGLPSIGKTTFAWQIADNLVSKGEPVMYISFEMAPAELYAKTIAREVYLESNKKIICPAVNIRRKMYGDSVEVQDKINYFGKKSGGVNIFKVGTESSAEVLELMRKLSAAINLSKEKIEDIKQPIFFIDYLQLVAVGAKDVRSEIDDFVRNLKVFQQETHSTVICLSSFNRDNYLNTVGFESFKESGGIEYTADVVLGLQFQCVKNFNSSQSLSEKRETLQAARQASPREVNIVCLKNRFGSLYEVDFDYYPNVDYFTCEKEDERDSKKNLFIGKAH